MRTIKKVFYLLIVLCLVLTGCGSNNTDDQEDIDLKQAEESLLEDEKDISAKNVYYEPGTFNVGVDIPAGEYVVTASNYIGIASDSSGEPGSLLAEHIGTTLFTYITINDGEYLKVSADTEVFGSDMSRICLADIAPPATNFDKFFSGTYKVGRDLPAGEYNVQLIEGEDSGYWEINSAPLGTSFEVIDNDYFTDSSVYVTVQDGEYLTLSGGAYIKNPLKEDN